MVAVVGGAGLGLANTSREVAGAAAGVGEAALGRGPDRATLNAASGNLVLQSRDEFLVGTGADIELLRTYNSQGGWDGDNADGWRIGYYRRVSGLAGTLNAAGSTVRRIEADGHEAVYAWDGSRYVGHDGAGAHDTLAFDAVTRVWTWTDGDTALKERYAETAANSGQFRLVQVTDTEGHATRIAYDGAGLISSVASWKAGATAADESLALQYDGGRRLTQMTTQYKDTAGVARSRVRVRYEYDGADRLSLVRTDLTPEDGQVSDGNDYTVRYGYDATGRLASVAQSDGGSLAIAYDAAGRVRQLRDALGRTTTLDYDLAARRTTVTDARGQLTVLSFDVGDRLLDIAGAATGGGTLHRSFGYDADGNLVSSRNPQGEETVFEPTAQGLLSRSTDAAGNVVERSYDAGNRLLAEVRYLVPDADGAAGPGVASGALKTRYLYDTSGGRGRLRFVVDPEGRVTQLDYNGLGQLAVRTRYADALYAATGEPTLADLVAWSGGLSAAQRAAVERSEYGYDLRGQQSLVRTFAANSVNGGSVVYGGLAEQRYVYDAFGRLRQSIDALGRSTAWTYDGMDRLLATTDAAGTVTLHRHDDAGCRAVLQFANGLERVSTFDAAGRLVSSAEQGTTTTALGETHYFYDALDRLVMTQDPTGLRRWTLYDAAGRRSADVDATGHFVEYAYDAAGRLVQTIDHAVPVSATALTGLVDANGQPVTRSAAELRPVADSVRDRIETRFYDRAGRLVAVQAADGAVTETQYDGSSRAVATVAYANVSAVTRADLSASSTLTTPPALALARPHTDAARDRTARNFYSDAGLLRATLDAEGYLVERRYDAAGRLVERLEYANATLAALRANGTLAQLLPSASAADRRCVYLYDGQGRQVGELDADGYLTETVYDARGNRRQSIRYATPILQTVAAGAALAAVRPAASASDRSTRWDVDPLDRVQRETSVDGSITRYDYDPLGRLVSTVRAEGTAEERTQTRPFDLQGRVVAELSAEGAALLAAAQTAAEADAVWAAHGSRISYDAAGRRIARQDTNGSLTLYYQDPAGREVCSILETAQGGEVRQTAYNAFGEVETVTSYANRLAPAELDDLAGGTFDADLAARVAALADPARDLRSTTLRTRRGQVAQAIDALGARTDTQYTAFGEIAVTQQDLSGGARLLTTRSFDRRGLLLATTADPGGVARVTRSSYDATGRLSSTTDARGQVTGYAYAKASLATAGRSVSETGPSGTRITVYDAFGGVLQQTDALGHTVRYAYDAAARRMTMTTAENVVVVTETTRHGEVARVTEGNGAVTTYAYDRDGHLLTTTDAVGNVEQHRYDAGGRRIATTVGLKSTGTVAPLDTGGTTTTETVYDAADRVLIRRVDPNGLRLETRYEYDGRGLVVKSTDPAGVVTTHGFDAAGRLAETVVDSAPGGLQLRTTYSYDADGRVLRVIEGAGTAAARTTETRYDALGRRTAEIVDPDGVAVTRRWEYDAAGHVVLERDPLGQPTRHVYDAAGRLALSIDPTGSVTQRLYDAEGRLTGLRAYAQRLGGTTTPDLSSAALSDAQIENAVATLAGVSDALRQYVLDRDGRVVYAIDPVGAVTKNRYDKSDRVVETIRYATLKPGAWTGTSAPTVDAARDQSTLTVYDAVGRLRYVVDALDFVTETAYDPQGRAVTVKRYAQGIARPAAASEASIATAVAARLDATNDRTEYSVYDPAGRLRFAVDAEGYVTENRYDSLGRVTDTLRSQTPVSFTTPPSLAGAEAAFRTTRSFTGSATGLTGTAHVYEANHIRLISRPESTGGTAITRGTTILEPGASVAFDLTPLGPQPDLSAALESPAGASLTRFGLVLCADGRIDARTIDRGSGIDQRVDIGAYVAGASYRVEIVTSEGGGAVLYVYERGKTRDTGIVYRCEEPLSWSAFSVLFQASRNPALTTESSATVDDLVESRATWLAQQRYDAAGRRVASIDGEGVVTRCAWDAAGRLVDTVAAAGRPEASTTRRVYDAAGRMLEETAAYGSAAASTTRYEYDAAGRLVARVDPRGLALARSDAAWAQSERAALGYPVTLAGLSAAQKQALSDRYTTRYEYDAAGHQTRSSEPLGPVTSVDYDAFGRPVRLTEPGGVGPRVSYTFYDRLGRAVQEVDAERYLTAKAYDAFGNLVETVRYDGRVAGTLATQSAGNASIAVGSADPGDGRAYVIAAPAADAGSRLAYDRRNQRLTERDAEGHVEGTLEALDAFGQRRSAVNRLGGRATFAYDRLGRLTRETLPVRAAKADGMLVDVVNQYGYDSRGNRVLSVEAVGLPEQRTTRYRFDNEHRQVLRTGMAYVADDGRSVTPADRLRYDAQGRVVEELTAGQWVDNAVVGGRRSLAWYDARGLRTAELSADAVLAQFTYDPAGQLVIHRIAATRLASPPTRPGGTAPTAATTVDDRKLTCVYDALGRRTETWLDGVWHWEFGQPVTLPGAERIALERLAYDAAGNVVQRTDARGNASYAYFDRLGRRLLAIDAEGYVTAWDYGRSLMQATRETRFAGRLAGGYARQDDATAALAARDPQALRSAAAQASAALPAGEAEADRTTSFLLDRLGRVVERRVAAVVVDDVAGDGTRRQRVADAVVQTDYDGLGHVVQTRELRGEASDPDGWEVTDIDYDLLGREVARSAPGFVDFRGVLIRPATELEYDGLGRVERRIQRGTTAGSEADDRITAYRYDGNGRLVEDTDAAGAVTRYAYDAAGHLALRTAVAVRRSDGSSRDLTTRYGYDQAGRVVAETDLDTGELRRTRYNAFGEVSGRGLGDGWQEFAEYTTLGKVWKTNAGDGAVKIYLHDRTGNTTREIKAAATVDLRAISLAAASRDETLLHATSVYDKRGLLRQTLEPEFALLASTVTLGQQFVEQWVPQYGDLNAAASTSQQASIQDGQRYTTVSAGSAALTPLSAITPGFTPSVDGIVLGAAPVQADPAVPAVMSWHALGYALPDGIFRTSAASIAGYWTYVYLPDDWPAGEYRVTETVGTDSVVITTTAAPGGPVKIGNLHGSTRTRSLQFDYRFASTEPWAPIATAQYTKDMDYESYTVEWGGLTVSAQPDRRVVLDTQVWGGAASFKVFLDPDGGAPTALAVKAFGTSTRFDAVDLPTLTGAHTVRIVALDASGTVLRGGDYAVGTTATDGNGNPLPADVSTLAPKTSTGLEKGSDGFVWVDYTGTTRTLRYQSSGTNLGTGVALRYRRAVTNGRGTWSGIALSGSGVDLKPLALADGNYEFVVEFGGTNSDLYRYGKFTLRGGSIVVPNSMLQRITRRSELVDMAGTSGGLVSLVVGGYTASAYVASGASSVRFDLGGLREKLGIDRWESGTATYAYTSKDAAGKVTHADRGSFTFGPSISVPSVDGGNAAAMTDGVTEYQPEALLTVAGAAGRVVVTPKTGGGTSASWTADGSDWHVRRQGDGLVVNLRQWLPAWGAAANTVQLRYEGSDGLVATVEFTVASNGTVTRASTVVQQTYKPELPLVVPGATTMRVFKVGIDDASVNAATVNEPIGGTGPNFVWNASNRLGQTLRYYYEAVDAAGKLVGKGRGKVVVAASGDITQTPDAPLPIPYVRFSPPTGTSSFTLQIRPQGSTAAYTAYTNGWTSGTDRVYDFDAKRPASGIAAYDYLFTAKDANGKILSKGSGTLGIQSSGAIAVTNVEEHVAVPVLFKLGRQVPKALLTVERNGVRTTATLVGTWVPPVASADGSPGRLGYTRFAWDAAAMGSSAGITVYDYTLVARDTAGNTVLDEIGRAVTQAGRIELDPSGSQSVQLLQKVEALNGADSVVVSRLQSHNAFGEVVEERDERVADRMADMLGRALTSAEQASARTTLRYDTRGRLISKTDPQAHVTLANGYRYRERPVTRYGYDLLGRLTTVTDANGNLSRRISLAGTRGDDSANTREILPDGGQRQTDYDVFGDARRIVDAEGHVVEQRFDGLSRLLQSDRLGVRRVVDDAGTRGAATTLSSRYSYDQLGRRLSQTDAAGQTIRTDYDGLGRVVRSVSGQGFETSYRYEIVAAGASGGVLGVGGANVGGIRLTATLASGRSTIDKIDYFGHTTWHRDLGGADTVYSYDRAARLVAQTGGAHAGQPAVQDIRYAYYANGFIQSVTDRAVGSVSEYGYDNAGNRTYEAYFQLVDGNKNANYQNATLTYDELNRLAGVRDGNYFDIRYEYDAKGNRRLVESVYWDGLAGLRSGRQTYWYDYDGMDRFVVTKGTLSGARATSRSDATVRVVAGAEGTVLAYDRLGQRRSATYTYDGQQVAETYDYSEDGYLETVRQAGALKGVRVLDAIGRTLQYHDKQNRTSTVSNYDADSRLLKQVYTDAADGANSGTTTYAYYSDASDSASSAGGAGALAKTVFTPDDASETFVASSYRYVYWDEAKQSEIIKQADRLDLPTWYPGRSFLYYNANGHLDRVWDQVASLDTRYSNSANGLILKREKLQNGTRVGSHFYYYAGGRRVGDVSDDPGDNPRISYAEQLATKRDEPPDAKKLYKTFKPVRSADFDQNFEPINESYPAAAPSNYTVRDSQDLQGIALLLWGDRSMWYLIAEANGLRGDETLVSGQVLVIPNKVTNIHNNADTFRPYNPGEAIGRIDPTLPPPPMPQSGGCGDMGVVVSVAIAIAVAAATGGAAGTAIASTFGVTGSAAVVAGYAAGAALGSAAGQAFNIATELQDGFSWRQVGQAALAGTIGSGIGELVGEVDALAFLEKGSFAAAGRAAIGSGVNQVLHGDWDWRGVMAAAVGTGVNSGVSEALEGVLVDNEAGEFGRRLIAVAAASTAGRMMFRQPSEIGIAFGNALGSNLADADSSPTYAGEQVAGDLRSEIERLAATPASQAADDGAVYLSREQEERLMSGRTVGDYGDGYADEDGLLVGSTGGVRRAGGDRLLLDRDKLSIEELQAAVAGGMLVLRRNELAHTQAYSELQRDDFRRFEIEQTNAASTMSREVARGDLAIRTSFPFPAEHLPQGGFFRGLVLGQTGGSVLDAYQAGFAENLGAGVRGLVLSPINTVTGLVGEVGSQYTDIYNLLIRSGESYMPSSALLTSLQREGVGGTLLNMGHSMLSAPSKPLFDLLEERYEEAGAGLPAALATGVGLVRNLRLRGDPPFSPIVPGGGLATHELAGGHLLLKHVGQTEMQLLDRLANEPHISGSSSFYDRRTAEAAVSAALDARQAEIHTWLGTSKPQMKLEYTLQEGVGISIGRGTPSAVGTSGLRLILRRDSTMPIGYRIHTGFPI